jgi:hypothetical protein
MEETRDVVIKHDEDLRQSSEDVERKAKKKHPDQTMVVGLNALRVGNGRIYVGLVLLLREAQWSRKGPKSRPRRSSVA